MCNYRSIVLKTQMQNNVFLYLDQKCEIQNIFVFIGMDILETIEMAWEDVGKKPYLISII